MKTSFLSRSARRFAGAAALGAAALAAACSGDLLSVEDPDVLNPDQLNSPSAATALRAGAKTRLTNVLSGQNSDNLALFGGLLADEWRSGDTFEQRNTMDQRTSIPQNTFIAPIFRDVMRIRTASEQAISATRDFDPTNVATGVSEMWAIRGMAAVLVGEHFCNGIPFSRLNGLEIEFGNPVPADSAFGLASAEADSALATPGIVTTSAAARLARVVKARALLNRGQYAAAATAIGGTAGVPTNFTYSTYHSTVTESNAIWSLNTSARRYSVSPAEGTNGLNFHGAADPRLPTFAGTGGTTNSFDTSTPFRGTSKWARYDSLIVASGIEARLIEAEAQWQTDMASAANRTTVTNMLNALRTAPPPGNPTMTALAVPADANAMTDLLFRERAFWMYSTGHRLGDLRRLVRQYGRGAETVYPTGAYHKGGSYGTMTVIQVPFDEENNPNYTGCTNLNP